MELMSRIGSNEDDIRHIKDSVYQLSNQFYTLIAEQKFLAEKIDHIGNKVNELTAEVRLYKQKIDSIEYYNQFKKEYINTIMNYIKIGAIVFPVLMGLIGYAAYDWGLYKPVPTKQATSP